MAIKYDAGKKLYHLTQKENIENILLNGLLPSNKSLDGVDYEENRVYFFTKPVLRTCEIDKYLHDRIQLEIIYDETYELFKDKEYNQNSNFIVYTKVNKPITVLKISDFQPKNIDVISESERMIVLQQIIERTEGCYN